jgi:hypothetical protein
VVIVEQVFRQTGGFREIASRGAILDREWSRVGHRCVPHFRRVRPGRCKATFLHHHCNN